MSVYVDADIACLPNHRWRKLRSCHLFADSPDELHSFALYALRLRRCWFQDRADFPHYDLSPEKRRSAVKQGAVPVSREFVVDRIRKARP